MQTFNAEEWGKVREAGKLPFLLRYGFFGRGLPLGAITAVAISAYRGNPFPEAFQTLSFYGLVAFCVSVFTVSGAIAANSNWVFHERRRAAKGKSS